MARTATVLVVLLALAGLSAADALMVTVAYDHEKIAVRHAELLSGEAAYGNAGNLVLAYETPDGDLLATWFYLSPIRQAGNSVTLEDYAEQTVMVPWYAGARGIAVYDTNGTKLASLSLEGVSAPGNAAGTPPKGSTADKTGFASVSKAIRYATGAVGGAGATPAGGYPSATPGAASHGIGAREGEACPTGSECVTGLECVDSKCQKQAGEEDWGLLLGIILVVLVVLVVAAVLLLKFVLKHKVIVLIVALIIAWLVLRALF
jgi:hypothetical protein